MAVCIFFITNIVAHRLKITKGNIYIIYIPCIKKKSIRQILFKYDALVMHLNTTSVIVSNIKKKI